MHCVTIKNLSKREIPTSDLAIILDCTEKHVEDIFSGYVPPSGREMAILRLCANVRGDRLAPIFSSMKEGSDWKPIPGHSRYEASIHGQVRRAKAGHGSMPGHVLRPRPARWGHLYVNIAPDDGPVKSFAVHTAVCMTFNGPSPSPDHMVCHRNDIKTDNTPQNLYWGTAADNAKDRVRNSFLNNSDTPVTRTSMRYGPPSLRQLKQMQKNAMTYRLGKELEKKKSTDPR
jgi:hypothetical protein